MKQYATSVCGIAFLAAQAACGPPQWQVTDIQLNAGANPAADCLALNNGQWLAGKDLPREVPLGTKGLVCGFATVKVAPIDPSTAGALSGEKITMYVDTGMFHTLASRDPGVDTWTSFYETTAGTDGKATYTTVLIARTYNFPWSTLSTAIATPPRGGMPVVIYGPNVVRKTCRFFAADSNQTGTGRIVCP